MFAAASHAFMPVFPNISLYTGIQMTTTAQSSLSWRVVVELLIKPLGGSLFFNVLRNIQCFSTSVLLLPTVHRNVPFFFLSFSLLQTPLPPSSSFFHPPSTSLSHPFKFSPDFSLKSAFSVLNQTYGMLL